MEKVLLSTRNCHRAATVRKANNPESEILEFKYMAQIISRELLHTARAHVVGDDTIVPNKDKELNKWEVISWKCDINFEDLWNLGVRAFTGTSFSPEERAQSYIRSYELELQQDLQQIPEQDRERYADRYKKWVITLLEKHSRILSPMITGPERFPIDKNEKAENSYRKSYEDFMSWREKVKKSIIRRAEASKTEDQKKEEEWQRIKAEIDDTAETLVSIDTGKNRYSQRSLFVAGLYGKLERVANHGNVEMIERAANYIKQLNDKLPKPIFTSRHKFWKLIDFAKTKQQMIYEKSNRQEQAIQFDGGTIVKNYSENRIQIIFDEKPSADKIAQLKQNAFRWSPRFKAWQRQLTTNSYFACARVTGVKYDELVK